MKYVEGQYNKTFLITFDDGSEVVAKLPNPNAGPKLLTTASEVATMEYVSVQIAARKSMYPNFRRLARLLVSPYRGSCVGAVMLATQ